MVEGRIERGGGHTVGYADYGVPGHDAVVWCHGGPGSRLEPQSLEGVARDAGLRIIGIDRPGYGDSTPRPGRVIADWVPDALAVLDHLGIARCAAVGCSTGGAYALALAALAPARVRGVIACCALTDMRWAEGKALMQGPAVVDLWSAPDRATALARATAIMGADGSKMLEQAGGPALPAADLLLLEDPAWLAGMVAGLRASFAHGAQGYTDDRLADGPGWGSFDVARVACPVIVLHGSADTIVPVAHAHHTAAIVPGAKLRVVDGLGHFSIVAEVLPALASLPR